MTNYRRVYLPGGTFFFTLVTHKRRQFLTNPLERLLLRNSIEEVQRKRPFRIDAFCLLPDHLHCVLTLPENDSDYSQRWGMIKRLFSQQYKLSGEIDTISQSKSRVKRKELPVWQRRFWEHAIRDDEDFQRHIDYVHFNPVKHGYVKNPYEYAWSTFHRFVREGLCQRYWGACDGDFKDFGVTGE